MSCDRFESMIALDAGGDLLAADGDRLARHLAACADCRRFAEEMRDCRRAVTLLADTPVDEEILAAVRAGVLREVETERAVVMSWRWPTRALALAATLAVAFGAWLLLRSSDSIPRPPSGTPGKVEAPALRPRIAEVAPSETPAAPPRPPATTPAPPASTAPGPATGTIERVPDRVAAVRAPVEPAIPQPLKPSPPVTVSPTIPPGPPTGGVAADATGVIAAAPAPEPTEPMVIKLVSDQADLVIYWLVQPAQAISPDRGPTEETKDEISAV